MSLTRLQRNGVYEALVEGGLNLAECKFSIQGKSGIIDHLPSESLLSFTEIDSYYGEPSYGGFVFVEDGIVRAFENLEWAEVESAAWEWASAVKETLGAPDLWAEYYCTKIEISGLQSGATNAPFAPDEQVAISKQLQVIKRQVKDLYSLSSEQLAFIETKLDEADEASHRIGRKDWMLLFYGLIFSLLLSSLVTPDVVQHILAAALHGLGHLFGVEGKPQISVK